MNDQPRITIHPDIMSGAPCIDGTRIPASAVKSFHEDGYTVSEIIEQYPTLTEDQVRVAIEYEEPVDEPLTYSFKVGAHEREIQMLEIMYQALSEMHDHNAKVRVLHYLMNRVESECDIRIKAKP